MTKKIFYIWVLLIILQSNAITQKDNYTKIQLINQNIDFGIIKEEGIHKEYLNLTSTESTKIIKGIIILRDADTYKQNVSWIKVTPRSFDDNNITVEIALDTRRIIPGRNEVILVVKNSIYKDDIHQIRILYDTSLLSTSNEEKSTFIKRNWSNIVPDLEFIDLGIVKKGIKINKILILKGENDGDLISGKISIDYIDNPTYIKKWISLNESNFKGKDISLTIQIDTTSLIPGQYEVILMIKNKLKNSDIKYIPVKLKIENPDDDIDVDDKDKGKGKGKKKKQKDKWDESGAKQENLKLGKVKKGKVIMKQMEIKLSESVRGGIVELKSIGNEKNLQKWINIRPKKFNGNVLNLKMIINTDFIDKGKYQCKVLIINNAGQKVVKVIKISLDVEE